MRTRLINRYPKLLVGLGATLLLVVAVPLARTQLASGEDAEVDKAEPLAVELLTLEPVSSYEVSRRYTGEIAALRSSDLGFQQGGELVDVLVQEGDRVTTGQSLAQLDTQKLQAQRLRIEAQRTEAQARLLELERGARQEDIAAAQAEVRDLENQLQLQDTQRSRREFLYAEGAISQEQLDEFSFGAEALEARLDRAKSQLNELLNGTRPEQVAAQRAVVHQLEASLADLDVDIRKSTLKAPFDGIISSQAVDEGAVVASGQAVLRLVEAVPEARIGMPVEAASVLESETRVSLEMGGDRYEATVNAVLPEVDPQTRTQVVLFQLPAAALPSINPGQTVRVALTETIPTAGYWLPLEALTQDVRGLWSVYGVDLQASDTGGPGHYVVRSHSVEVLHEESAGDVAQSGPRVLVQGTLQPGDRVVSNGVHRLVPGQRVQPL